MKSLMKSTPQTGQAVEHAGRLEALRQTGLLDSLADDSFDRFTRLAAALLGTDISLVSLVDSDRQFFKSQFGLPDPVRTARQTPLSHSFCKHVVQTGLPFVIDDARQDPRVSSNPSVIDLKVIAYLGMPLTTRDGMVLGSLCVINPQPRKWSTEDQNRLSDLAAAVMREIELRDRSVALKESLQAAQEMEEAREKQLRMIVHDLRTPAGVVSSCITLLTTDGSVYNDEQLELMQMCAESSVNLLEMIQEILETDRINSDGTLLDRQSLSASLLVRRAVRMVLPLADDAGVHLEIDIPDELIHLNADQRKLERVLLNLLTNALKFSPSGSPVLIRVQRTEAFGAPMCQITIRDHGPGVPDEEKELIFQQFVTGATPGERGMPSFGIGLSFCRTAVTAHGGRIWVADAPGGGSEFHCLLPLTNSW